MRLTPLRVFPIRAVGDGSPRWQSGPRTCPPLQPVRRQLSYVRSARVGSPRASPCPQRAASGVAFLRHGFLWRRLRRHRRKFCPNGAQQPDPRRQRIAIVLDCSVQQREERSRLLIGQVELHGLQQISSRAKEEHEALDECRSAEHAHQGSAHQIDPCRHPGEPRHLSFQARSRDWRCRFAVDRLGAKASWWCSPEMLHTVLSEVGCSIVKAARDLWAATPLAACLSCNPGPAHHDVRCRCRSRCPVDRLVPKMRLPVRTGSQRSRPPTWP
jgi:hypothetical protein